MVVYFIQAGESAIKIGITDSIESRLTNLKTGNHEHLKLLWQIDCPSREKAEKMEQSLHSYFRDVNLKGEWFKATPFVLNCIKMIKDEGFPAFADYTHEGLYFEVWGKLSDPLHSIGMIAREYLKDRNYPALNHILREIDELKIDIKRGQV